MASDGQERRRYKRSRSKSRERSTRSRERGTERYGERRVGGREYGEHEYRKRSRDRYERRTERERVFSDRWVPEGSKSPDRSDSRYSKSSDRSRDRDSRSSARSRDSRSPDRYRERNSRHSGRHEDDRYHARTDDEDDWEYRSRWKERRASARSGRSERGWESSDSESDYDHRGGRHERYRRSYHRGRDQPTSTLYIRGIPEDKDESDLHRLFGGWAGISQIRVSRDRLTGRPRGFAFVEFESVDAAEDVMEREGRYIDLEDGTELTLAYSHGQMGGTVGSQPMDWICSRCQATNFARRTECHQCSGERPRDARLVSSESDGPAQVLKVSNLEATLTEEALHYHISPHAPVKSIRLIMDRQLGAPKGYAFVHFHSVADASKVLHTLQDSTLDGQTRPLRFVFARDRTASRPLASTAASNALEAAQLMAGYSSWAPAKFDESALDGNTAEQRNQDGPAAGSLSKVPGPDGGVRESAAGSDFQYDSASGYYFHAASGFYYDANSGLYYDSTDQQWKRHDPQSGQYLPVEGQASQGAQPSSAAQAAIAATTAAVESAGHLQAPQAEYKPPSDVKRRGAVIGSAAKLNPEGVLAAAKEAEAREEAKRKQEARAAKMAAKKQQRQGTAPQHKDEPQVPSTAGAVKGVIRSSGKWGGQRGANNMQP